MHQLGRAAGSAGGKILRFDQQRPQAGVGRLVQDACAGDAASYNDYIPGLVQILPGCVRARLLETCLPPFILAACRGSSCLADPGCWSSARRAMHSQAAFLCFQVGQVIDADAVLVADRAAIGDDRLACGRFHALPARQDFLRIEVSAEYIGHIDACAVRIDMGEMGENQGAFAIQPFPGRPGWLAGWPGLRLISSTRAGRFPTCPRRSHVPRGYCGDTASGSAICARYSRWAFR